MFTGLIEEVGRIASVEPRPDGRRMWMSAREVLADATLGDSLSVSGCCLTVVELGAGRVAVDAVPETLRRTTLGALVGGDAVNLERALHVGQRLGGHFVQGHVDGVGEVAAIATGSDAGRMRFVIPPELRRFVAMKGSLTIDGVSLTVAGLTDDGCEIAYIPHTLSATTAGSYEVGRRVNLEVDLLARYLDRLLEDAGANGRKT